MGALARLQRGVAQIDLGFPPGRFGIVRRLGIAGLDTGVGIGASYALGQVHGRYGHKDGVKHVPVVTGILGKFFALVASALGGGSGYLSGGLNAVGQAGLNAHFLSWGIEDGCEAAGRQLYVLPPGADVPKGLPAGTKRTVLGEIPPAAPGRYLRRDLLRNMARQL